MVPKINRNNYLALAQECGHVNENETMLILHEDGFRFCRDYDFIRDYFNTDCPNFAYSGSCYEYIKENGFRRSEIALKE